MEARKKYEEILQSVSTLSEEQQAKVISLIERLQEEEKKRKSEDYKKAIERAWGFLEGSPSGTEEFIKERKKKRNLNAKWASCMY